LSGSGWYAIDGPSGSGKSTLLDLMLGLRLPTEGQVTINGLVAHEFIDANPGSVSYLPQSPMVMNRSLWENVAFGYTIDDVDRNRVTRCLQQVGLESLVRRADANGETLGERGGRLSGGQLQRLGIARCLYQEPNVLVLDESTSGLDESARDGIISLLHSLVASGLTVVTVAHDRTLAAQATQVIRLANGKQVNS
jgi:ABC-type bacteriocin/lantibiotic exporter with double-glycine peptidase domain